MISQSCSSKTKISKTLPKAPTHWVDSTAVSIFVNILVGLTYISTNIETAVLSRYMLSIFYRFATEAIDAAVEVGGRLKLGEVWIKSKIYFQFLFFFQLIEILIHSFLLFSFLTLTLTFMINLCSKFKLKFKFKFKYRSFQKVDMYQICV